jgi:uncharacterized protein
MPEQRQLVSTDRARCDTVRWLERAVIGLNLCPFAKAPHVKGRIHIAVCQGDDDIAWVQALRDEINDLMAKPAAERETTLLVIPNALGDFFHFNDQLAVADLVLREQGHEGILQIASFHPHYQFEGTEPEDITNHTNRSPYPILHLIREDSIDQAVAAFARPEVIFEANMRTLRELGSQGWAALDVGPRS